MPAGIEAPKTAHSARAPLSDALRRLRAGEATLDEYLDYRADQAIAHLGRILSAEQLKLVRETVRRQLASDPVVLELVRQSTGIEPPEAADAG